MAKNGLTDRRKFKISCKEGVGVIIEDGNGKKGGNVRAKGGKELSWKNATDESVCYLKFTAVPEVDGVSTGQPVWPFSDDEPSNQLLEVPKGKWSTGTLKSVAVTTIYEYIVLGADKNPLLDPIIIVDP